MELTDEQRRAIEKISERGLSNDDPQEAFQRNLGKIIAVKPGKAAKKQPRAASPRATPTA